MGSETQPQGGVVRVFFVVLALTVAISVSVGLALRPPAPSAVSLQPRSHEAALWVDQCARVGDHETIFSTLFEGAWSFSGSFSACSVTSATTPVSVVWEFLEPGVIQAGTVVEPFSVVSTVPTSDGVPLKVSFTFSTPKMSDAQADLFGDLVDALRREGMKHRCVFLASALNVEPSFEAVVRAPTRSRCVFSSPSGDVHLEGPVMNRALLPASPLASCSNFSRTNFVFRVCGPNPSDLTVQVADMFSL